MSLIDRRRNKLVKSRQSPYDYCLFHALSEPLLLPCEAHQALVPPIAIESQGDHFRAITRTLTLVHVKIEVVPQIKVLALHLLSGHLGQIYDHLAPHGNETFLIVFGTED